MKKQLQYFLENYIKELEQAAGELSRRPMPQITEELFAQYERTGNRLRYEAVYFLRRKYLAVFGLMAVLYRRSEDIKKLEEVIRGICEEFCWALPAHVDRKNDSGWRYTLDLFACETAGALAEICALLSGVLDEQVRRLTEGQVRLRVLEPFAKSAVPCGKWENCGHNWNAVCGGSIGLAVLYLMREEPKERRALLERICSSLRFYIDGFAGDGACMEGVGYYTYGMSYYTAFADLLRKEPGGENLLAGEKLARIMEFQQKCYFPGGLSVSFSDGSSYERFRVGLACFLNREDSAASVPPLELAAGLHTDPCSRWVMLYRDYSWTKEYLEHMSGGTCAGTGGASCTVLPDAQWSICRSASGAGLAVKGGTNGEPHNHNDVGSFHYAAGGEIFLADLGAGEYTKEYFQDETRYDIFVNQSFSHNVPVINRKPQKHGREYGCGSFAADGMGRTELEFSDSYGEPALYSLRRTVRFDTRDGSAEVTDTFEGTHELEAEENLVTPWEPRISGTEILLEGKKNICRLSLETGTDITVKEQTYADHQGERRHVFLLRFAVPVKNGKGRARFTVCSETRAENSLPAS